MTRIIKKEWQQWKKDLIIQLSVSICIPFIFFILYKIKKTLLFQSASFIYSLPQELYTLLGLSPEATSGNITFYLLFPTIFLFFYLLYHACTRTVRTVYSAEADGSIYLICNQLFTRKQLARTKLLWSFISFWSIYILWNLSLILMVCIGAFNKIQRIQGIHTILRLMTGGIFVSGMFISFFFLQAVYQRRRNTDLLSAKITLILCTTLLLGNLYKIRNLILWFLGMFDLHNDRLIHIRQNTEWLDNLYWLSPLSWINPYRLPENDVFFRQLAISAVILSITALLSIKGYQKRNFYDN